MRQCGNCGADISHRAPQARFCEDAECHRVRMLAHGRAAYHRNREGIRERQNAAHRARVAAKLPKPQNFCAYCGVEISHRRKWCNLRCRDKARHRTDPSRARQKIAKLRLRDPDRVRATNAAWRKRNPERFLDQSRRAQQKRRAWKLEVPGGGISHESWRRLLIRHEHRCAYCGRPSKRLTQDHVVPLARGGAHSEGNILPACMPCNNSKSDRLVIEWRAGRRISRKLRPALHR